MIAQSKFYDISQLGEEWGGGSCALSPRRIPSPSFHANYNPHSPDWDTAVEREVGTVVEGPPESLLTGGLLRAATRRSIHCICSGVKGGTSSPSVLRPSSLDIVKDKKKNKSNLDHQRCGLA